MQEFQVAVGSTIGKDHIQLQKNNQDGYCLLETPEFIVGVVSDGCGSGDHSEVGAKYGARLVAHRILLDARAIQEWGVEKYLGVVQSILLHDLSRILCMISQPGTYTNVVNDYGLFTVLGLVMTPQKTVLFSVGDGVLALNGEVKELEASGINEPDYFAYGLVSSSKGLDAYKFTVQWECETSQVDSIMLATDGLKAILHTPDKRLPVSGKPVGPVSQFWETDLFFQNRDGLRRRLSLMNRAGQKIDWDKKVVEQDQALLHDDTTVMAVRRKPR